MLKKLNFEAETQEILNLVTHAIYSDKNIFLRELISNSSDALEKLQFLSLTDPEIMKDRELAINIEVDKENNILAIEDNGVGMTKDEIISNIGTIAKSGTKEFAAKILGAKDKGERDQLIGQFGVGFYSSFMVAKEVRVISKSKDGVGVHWRSEGGGSYEIDESSRKEIGTRIEMLLKDDCIDLLSRDKIVDLVKEHSNYIQFPIKVITKGEDEKVEKENEIVNSQKPLWDREKGKINESEYSSFYKSEFHDWEDPFDKIDIKVEGNVEYSSLIFIPQRLSPEFFSPGYSKGLKLYSKNILIMESCTELLPRHLQFVSGVVNSSDISLNISREMLQKDESVRMISKNLEKKIVEFLENMFKKDREKYNRFWEIYGQAIKMGIYSNAGAKDKLKNLLMFETSESTSPLSLKEIVEKSGDSNIFYAAGESREKIEALPQMENFLSSSKEVLYFKDPIDELVVANIGDYENKKFVSVSQEAKDEYKVSEEEQKILDAVKEELGDRVSGVKISNKLSKSPACISSAEGVSLNMERVFKGSMGGIKANKVLEINKDHVVFTLLKDSHKKDPNQFKDYVELTYHMASILEGITVEKPSNIVEKISSLMLKAGEVIN